MRPNFWILVGIISRKEMSDNLRDRRSVFNALLSVLLNPLLYIVLFGFLNRSFADQVEQTLQLPVVGAQNAPNLVAFLDQYNVDILPPPADPRAAVQNGEADVVLVIPDAYAVSFSAGEPASVELIQDESNQGTSVAGQRVTNLLGQYSDRMAALRLLARGINPALITAVPVIAVDVSPAARGASGTVLGLLPIIMLTAAFLGGFYMVVDMTAGERERESLEPLLINPVPRAAFVLGKYLTAFTFTILATTLATVLFLVLLGIPAVQSFTAIQVDVEAAAMVTAISCDYPGRFYGCGAANVDCLLHAQRERGANVYPTAFAGRVYAGAFSGDLAHQGAAVDEPGSNHHPNVYDQQGDARRGAAGWGCGGGNGRYPVGWVGGFGGGYPVVQSGTDCADWVSESGGREGSLIFAPLKCRLVEAK